MVVRYSSSEMCGSLIRVGESARPITKQMAKAPDAADADGTLEHITVEHNREVARAPRERAASQIRRLAASQTSDAVCPVRAQIPVSRMSPMMLPLDE